MVVLVVDDEPLIAMGTAMILAEAGFVTIEATSVAEAMDVMAGMPVDLVLTDYRMPRSNGAELARAMRQDPRLNGIPVVLMSGYVEEATRGNANLFTAVVQKPFHSKDLIATIETALSGSAERL